MEHYNPSKGKLKQYNFWLDCELEDISKIAPHDPKIENLFCQISKNLAQSKQKEAFSRLEANISTPETVLAPPKTRSLLFWKSSTDDINFKIASFLKIKDLANLLFTCKTLYNRFDISRIWAALYNPELSKVNDYLKNPFYISFKELLRHQIITSKVGVLCHSSLMISNSSSQTHELIRNLIDFVSASKFSLKLTKFMKDVSTADLKLSLIKERNEVVLWISGFETVVLEHATQQGVDPEKVTRTNSFILREYALTDNQRVFNAFFLGQEYVVLEYEQDLCETEEEKEEVELERYKIELNLKKLEERDCETKYSIGSIRYRKAKGFSLFCLGNEFKYFRNKESLPSLKCCFYELNEDMLKAPSSTDTINVCLGFEKETEVWPYKIEVKHLNEDNVIFFTKNLAHPLACVCNVTTRDLVCKINLLLDVPLYELIIPKREFSTDEINFYAIDNDSSFYWIKFTIQNKELTMNQIITNKSQQVKERCAFKNTIRKYHHGTYNSQENGIQCQKEYLIIYKSLVLYFIDLNNLKAHKLHEVEPLGFHNWSIYEDKLWVFSIRNRITFLMSFSSISLKEISRSSYYGGEDTSAKALWIFHNPCFSVQVISKPLQNTHTNANIQIFSTQELVMSSLEKLPSSSDLFELSGIINRPDEDMTFKFEDERLLIITKTHSWFFDFEIIMKKNKASWIRWPKKPIRINFSDLLRSKPLDLNFVSSQEKPKVDEKRKQVKFGGINRNPNTKGRQRWQKSGEITNTLWSTENSKKELTKSRRSRGSKYHKKIRENGRSIKVMETN